MGGMGPPPKAAALRQRRNKVSTAAVLPAPVERRRRRVPKLPSVEGQEWHPLTVAFWRDIWSSPMAAELLEADIHGLYVLADLVNRYWSKPSVQLAAEIRQQRQCFGLTPIDRRRLQWEVQRVDPDSARALKSPPAQPAESVRDLLSVLS
jgi:hypothetical protein